VAALVPGGAGSSYIASARNLRNRKALSLQVLILIIFAGLAAIVLYQLYAVLGRRVGRQPEDTPAVPATAQPLGKPDLTAPPIPENRRPHIAPTLFQLKNTYSGDGYVYGSSPQGMDDRKAATIPGVTLSVPIR